MITISNNTETFFLTSDVKSSAGWTISLRCVQSSLSVEVQSSTRDQRRCVSVFACVCACVCVSVCLRVYVCVCCLAERVLTSKSVKCALTRRTSCKGFQNKSVGRENSVINCITYGYRPSDYVVFYN